MRIRLVLILALHLVCGLTINAQTSLRDQLHAYRSAHEKQILSEFVNLLSLPNHAGDTADIERNAQTISAMLQARGVAVRLLTIPGASPVVFGELRAPGPARTIGITPTTTASLWTPRSGSIRLSARCCVIPPGGS
jgi:hypothetical protein